MNKMVLASNNAGKLAEFSRLLAELNIDIVSQGSLNVPECDEPFQTFVENALRKARHASSLTGLPALADDSGICVPALNGAPGVQSARYADVLDDGLSKDARNSQKLIHDLSTQTDKRAYFYCVLVLVRHPNDPQPIIVDGQWWGEVVDQPQGEGGFGYDPHFYLATLNKTAAQLDKVDKNKISHRGQAVARLIDKLRSESV
ncbi:MAG: RdgB/HAM1 family non-canonical purine NTP pyrophosphatase [Formosimonas sp.]|jgi:XTP/dITP diphosphohydrolase